MSDLRDDIKAAMAEFDAPEAVADGPVADASIPEPVEVQTEAVDETPEPQETDEKGPKRGPDGKFLAKDGEPEQDAPKVEGEAEPQEAIRPPATWTPAAKAKFATLDPVIQQEVLKREKESYRALEDRARQIKRYEPLDAVIEPYRQKWQVAGVDEATAVKQLLAASDWLERDASAAIAYLAKQYGVTVGQPGAAQSPQGPAQHAQPPEFQQLQAEIASLKAQVQQASQAPLVNEVQAFMNDPANLYAENVRDDMALLLDQGRAQTLKEAYDMACYMNPEIRPLLLQPSVPVQTQQAKVEKARRAAVSVTGTPSAAPIAGSGDGSIRDDILKAYQEVQGRA